MQASSQAVMNDGSGNGTSAPHPNLFPISAIASDLAPRRGEVYRFGEIPVGYAKEYAGLGPNGPSRLRSAVHSYKKKHYGEFEVRKTKDGRLIVQRLS